MAGEITAASPSGDSCEASMRPEHNGRGNKPDGAAELSRGISFNEARAQWPGKFYNGAVLRGGLPAGFNEAPAQWPGKFVGEFKFPILYELQ